MMKMEAFQMVQMLGEFLSSKLVINLILLGIAGGLFSIARKLKA